MNTEVFTATELRRLIEGYIAGQQTTAVSEKDVRRFVTWATRVKIDNAIVDSVLEGQIIIGGKTPSRYVLSATPAARTEALAAMEAAEAAKVVGVACGCVTRSGGQMGRCAKHGARTR